MAQIRKVQIVIEAQTDQENHEIENTSNFAGLFLRRGTFHVTNVKVIMHETSRSSGMVSTEEKPAELVEE